MSRVDNIISGVRKNGTQKKKSRVESIIEGSSNGNIKTGVDEQYINNFIKDVNEYFTSVNNDYKGIGYNNASSLYENYFSKGVELGNRSNTIRAFLNSNKNKLDEDIYNQLTSTLNNFDRSRNSVSNQLRETASHYSRFKSEKEYEDWKIGWLQPDAETNEETTAARKDRYTQNQTRISEIDKQIEALKKDGFTTEYERGSRKSVVKYRNQNEITTLTTEKETLQAENTRYEREQKALDDYYTPVTDEFLANGAYRNYPNASREDLWRINANQSNINNLLSSGTYKWDSNGNIVNVYSDKIEYTADDLSRAMLTQASDGNVFNGGFFDTDKSDNAIDQYYDSLVQDKLGLFLSASEDDIVDAYSELASHPTDYNNTWANVLQEGDQNAWEHLSEHEVNIYYNLYKTQGQAAAYKYLDEMTVELTKRETQARQAKIAEASGLEQVWLNIESIPKNVFGGVIGFVEDTANIIRGEDINPYSAAHSWRNDAEYVRQVTAEDINNMTGNAALPWLGTTWGDAYQAIMSAGDSALGLAVGSTAYGTMMGMGAASSEMKHLYEIGASTDQMLAGGLLAGAAEMVFEKYSIDKLVAMQSPQSMKQILKNFFMQGGIEASEEMATEIANTITNSIVMGSQSDWVDTETFVKNVLNSGLSGFISGGFMGGGGSVLQYAGNQIQNIEKGHSIMEAEGGVDALRTIALDRIQNSSDKTRNEISKLSDKVSGEKVKASNVGKLYRATNEANSEQNKTDIVKSLERKGFSSKEASSIAEAIVAQSSGQTLTKEQAKLVESLKGDERIAKTLNDVVLNEDSTVGQRTADLSMFDMGIANGVGISPNIQQTEKNIVKASLKKEITESEYKVSDDGKTTNLKTGQATAIKNIDSISESGEANLTLDDGMVVKASDIAFSSPVERAFVENIGGIKLGKKNISTASANALYQFAMTTWKNNLNMSATEALSLVKGLEESFVYGAYYFGKTKLTDSEAVAFANELTEEQRTFAYDLGTKDSVSKAEADQKVIDDLKAKGKSSKKSLGKVVFEDGANVDESTLTATQKANLNGIKLLAELSSVEFHIFKSEKVGNTYRYTAPDGTVNSANGWYVAGSNQIWIDLNAGNFGEGTMIRTAAHEISHYIKQWSPKKWQAMADLLMEEFAKNGVNTESMLNRQIAKIKRRYSKENMPSEAKLLDMAYEELVSDALSDMLTDGSIVNFMAEVKAKDRTLWQKIKNAIENLLKKWGLIIEDYKGRSLDTAEAQALSQLEDTFKKLQAMYQEAFIDANEAVATIGARNLADFAEAKNTEGESLFQYRAMEADEATYREMLRKWGKMSDAQINNLFTTIDKAMDIIKDNLEVLDYAWESDIDDRAFSPVKPNSDSLYQVSLDFSTLCRKRILQQTIQAQLQEALKQPLTREEGIAIRDALVALQEEGRQIEVACALCYVESARMKSPAQIKKFLNNREKVLKDFFAGKSGGSMKAKIKQAEIDVRENLHKENPNGIKGKDGTMLDPRTASLKAMSSKYANTIRDAKKAAKESYKPTAKEQELIDVAKGMTVSDFTTPEGLENLAKNYPALFDAYTSYVRNATKSKGIEGDTWWRAGDSQNIGDVLIANMNRENGLRSQSWSDFQVIHILDYIAATIELSTRNAKEQAYSKVPDYVELMGQTGVMINMSLIPTRDFNGKLEYDPVEGMDYKRALALREKYPATAGTICIGIDNVQIQKLLADINIDYVIPYHKSGMAASVRKLMHMPTWSEYEDYQSEKNLSSADAEAQAKKYGVTLLVESDPNYHKQTSFSEWFNLKEAKQIAKMENANPTNKAMQEKYGVMYGGYVAMQNAANNYLKLCAERGISPKFSHEKADFTVEDNYWKLLIDRKMVNNATGEIIEQQAIKPIFDEGEVLRILNDELERYPSVKADQDYATRKVTEKFLSGEIKSGMSAEAIAKVMKTPVDNITKTNILASEREIKDFDSSDKLFSDRDSSGRELSKGQQKYFAKSKVRDRYGNLLRLFHGSDQGGFTIFDPKKSDDTLCLFLTDTIEMAESYSGSRKPIRTPSPKPNILRWLDGGTKKAGKQQGVYEVYANITNPMVIEAKGRNFNQLSVDAPNTKDVNLKVAGYENDMRIEITIGKENYVEYFYNFDEAMNFVARKLDKGERSRLKAAFFKGGFINIDTDFKWDTQNNHRVPYLNIRDIAKIAKERGHDGVIVKDVTDYDNRYGTPEKTPPGTVVVAFKSNQIKDVHNPNPTKSKDIRYSDRDSADAKAFAHDINQWNREGRPDGESFILGSTGDVLQGLGAIESDIYMLGEKINEILLNHPEMTLDEIKKIPQILENPILILKSRSEDRGNRQNTRLVIFGSVKAKDNRPVLSVLDLRPQEGNLIINDMQKVTSAYTKDNNPVNFVRNSDILYADKNKTTRLLKSIGFHMPIELQQSGYIGSISYFKRSVNIKGETFSNVFKESSEKLYSLRDVDPIEPTSNKWQRTLTTSEVKEKFPDLWDVSADESEVRNPTQISGTVRSYRKVYDFLKKTNFKGNILDASSGLGYGTKAGIEEYGFDVEDIEPYPDKSYYPKYTDYSSLDKKYDVIISNAVLNVLPQDQRDALVVKMGELLKKGGRMFINVRGDDVRNASSKVAINEDLMEYYISKSGSYQKGFTKSELVAYLQDALGDGFSVTPTTFFGKTSAVVTKNEGKAKYSERDTSTSNRSILANSLESAAQNDIERNKLAQYKEKIALIESEEQRLSEIQKQLFTKGGVDPSQRKDLQFEAKQIANRITTYDRQLLNLEATTALKNVLSREKALAMKRQKQKDAEAMRQYKEKVAKTTRELMDRHQASRKKAIEGREKTAMRHKIQKVVSELNQLLLRGTKDKHVMIGLQKVVAEALDAVNMDTVGADERVAHYNDLIAKAKDSDVIASLTETRDRIQQQGDKMSDELTKLKNAYNDIKKSDDPLIANSYDEVISSRLDYIAEKVGNTPLRDMSLEQLEDVYDMYKMVLTTIRNSNKSFKNAKNESIATLGNRVMMEVEKIGGNKKYVRSVLQGIKKFGWNSLKPIYAFRVIGSNTFTDIFNTVRAGEDTWAVDVSEAKDFYQEKTKKYNYNSWDLKQKHSFESATGKSFDLTLEQIMSLYAYSKREQADLHLRYGGFVFDSSIEVTEKSKLGIPMKYKVNTAEAYNLSADTLGEIVETLTEEQKAFVDEMQSYLSDVMGEKGNEVSLEMYGVKLFKENNYFPLKSANQFMFEQNETAGEVKIKNSGFSKETVPKANNPIILNNFTDVWANHVNDMSMYHSFVLPLEDFNRVFNYKTPASDSLASESVKMFLQNAYGEQATQYVKQLLTDLNGGARVDSSADWINKSIGLFKKAGVFASASVVIQQPSALARAWAYINPKYFVFTKMGIKDHGSVWNEVKKYAPVAVIKEMGRFDTHIGRQTTEWIKSNQYEGISQKAKALVTDSAYRDDVLSRAPALADEIAWCYIWNAVKKETKATTNLKEGSEEFLKKCGERFTEVVTHTQVYDSVLSRSGHMRSKDTGMKMATAFMAEPTTAMNMALDSHIQSKRGNKKAARQIVGGVVASVILNSILVSIVYAARDDDDDETYAEKYLGSLTTELIDGFNPLTYIPFVKDLWSIGQGYDVERSDMSIYSNLWQSVENLFNEDMSGTDKALDFAGSVANIFGLPLKNIVRDARAIGNVTEGILRGTQTTGAGIGYALQDAIRNSVPLVGRFFKEDSNSTKLYDAIVSGDQVQIDRIKSLFKDDKAIESAMRKALRENDTRIKEAAQARIDGDIAEYTRIVKAIKGEGNFVQDTIVAAVNAEINALNKGEDSSSSSDKAKSMYKIDDYFKALDGGDEASAYVVKEDLIETDVANGKDREDAEESFISKFASHLREQYEEGNLSESEAQRMLVKYGEKTEEEAASKVQYWDFKQEYPDYDDLSEEAVKKYYNEVEPYGITVDVYYDYSKQRSKCKGVDANGDGKTDSGSVKSEVLWVIHSLPLTYAQKDALYYLNGWSAKTIYEAPWH